MICSIGQDKFTNWFVRTFIKDFNEQQAANDMSQESVAAIKELAQNTFKDLVQVAAPLMANALFLSSHGVSLDFATPNGKSVVEGKPIPKEEDSMDDLFGDVEFGQFDLN
jgi:hypothetical protein